MKCEKCGEYMECHDEGVHSIWHIVCPRDMPSELETLRAENNALSERVKELETSLETLEVAEKEIRDIAVESVNRNFGHICNINKLENQLRLCRSANERLSADWIALKESKTITIRRCGKND